MENLRENSNFYSKQIHIRDQLKVNVFVNLDKLDLEGRLIGDADQASNSDAASGTFVMEEEQKQAERQLGDSSDVTDYDSDEESEGLNQ